MAKGAPQAVLSGKRETIRRVMQAARQEFAAAGIAASRIDSIAQTAGVTKQLVYHYFESKEKLFAAVLAESSASIMSELLSLDVEHLAPPEALRAFLNHIFDQYQFDPDLRSLAQEGMRYHEAHPVPGDKFSDLAPSLVECLKKILDRGIDSGDFKPDVNVRIFVAIAALIMSGGFTHRFSMSVLAGFDTTSPEGMAAWREHSADFVLAAISSNRTNA